MKRAAAVLKHHDGPGQPLTETGATVRESLPFRSRCRNIGTATAAPAALFLIATRASGADAAIPTLRTEVSDLSRAGAVRHAVQVLAAMVARYPGQAVDVQLIDAGNLPVVVCSGGAA